MSIDFAPQDFLQSFIIEDTHIRGTYITLDESFQTIRAQHNYPAPVEKLLGELLACTAMIASNLKNPGEFTIQLNSNSAISMLVAKCNHRKQIRGLAQWDPSSLESDLSHLGTGSLVATIQHDAIVRPYQSIISLQNNSLIASLESYFLQSEQLATFIWVNFQKNKIQGLMLQMLPTENNTSLAADNWQASLTKIEPLLQTITQEKRPDEFYRQLSDIFTVRLFPFEPLEFVCHCSQKKMLAAVKTLHQAEIEEILASQHFISITCEFCNQEYQFNRHDLLN